MTRSALLQETLGKRIFRAKLCKSYATLTPDRALINHYYGLLLRENGARSFLQTLQLFHEADLQRLLPSLDRPVLSIWGDKDRVLSVSKSVAIQQLVRDCWSVVIPGAGHLPHEEEPVTCAKLIERFLGLPSAQVGQ